MRAIVTTCSRRPDGHRAYYDLIPDEKSHAMNLVLIGMEFDLTPAEVEETVRRMYPDKEET